MLAQIEQPFRAAFDKLLEDEGHANLADFLTVNTFDEVPLYYRLSHVSFLDGLEVAERNKLAIRAAVLHLSKIVNYASEYYAGREDPCLCMVTVTNWWVPGESGLYLNDGTVRMLTPCFWIGNMKSPVMQAFTMDPPDSVESEFANDALGHPSCVRLHEGWSTIAGERYIERVYVELVAPVSARDA